MRASRPTHGAWPILLASLSGAAGLAHQLLWVRRMVDILGAGEGTFTRVIAAFFLGLAAGSWFASRQPTPRPWRSVALAELIVALLATVMLLAGGPALALQGHAIARWLPDLLPLLLVAPPAFAMGTVMPWMIRATAVRLTALLYGANTLAGIVGLLLITAWLLPWLGLAGASLAAIALNLTVAVIAWRLDARGAPEAITSAATVPSTLKLDVTTLLTAFASGFLVLASEVMFQHQFAQFFVSSFFSSAAVLCFVLLALGAGALLVPLLSRTQWRLLPMMLALSALAFAAQPMMLVVQRGGLIYLPFKKTLPAYTWDAALLGLPACVLPLLPAALVFPLLLQRSSHSSAGAGRLLAINGLGGWLGAGLTERYLAPHHGLWWSMALISAGYALCFIWHNDVRRWWFNAALAAVIAVGWRIDATLPHAGTAKNEKLVVASLGREGVVGVVRGEPDDWRIIFNNNYTLGGSRAQFNQERQTLLPMLLHGEARRVATLGVATGSSLAGATLDPLLEQAEGIELSPIVLHFAQGYFAPYNRDIAHHPRVKFTIGDARIVITQRHAEFDVIEGDLFLPWRTGEGRLFTKEHFQNVRAALKPGGLYCQWLPMFQLTRSQYDTIARTFREVFPEAWLLRGDFYAEMPILGIVGGRNLQSLDWPKITAACDRVRRQNDSHDPLLRHPEGIAMCLVGPLSAPPEGPLNTLANARLEWDAAHNLIGLRDPWFVGVPYASYLADISLPFTVGLPLRLREAHDFATWLHALEIAGSARLSKYDEMAPQAARRIPSVMLLDGSCSWRQWPMKYRPNFP